MCYWYQQKIDTVFLMTSISVTITIYFVVGLCIPYWHDEVNTFTGLWKGRYPYLFCIIINVRSILDTAVGLIRIRHGDSDNRNWLSCVFSASLEAEGGGTEITPWIGECKPIASQLIRPLRVRQTPLPAPPYHPTWWNTEPRDEPSFLAFIRGILVSKFQRHFLRSFRTFNMSSFH